MVGNVGMLKWFAAGRYFLGGRKEHEEPGGSIRETQTPHWDGLCPVPSSTPLPQLGIPGKPQAQQLASEERLEVGTEKKPPKKPPGAIFEQGCHGNAPLRRARHV